MQSVLDDINRLGDLVRSVVFDPTSGPIHIPYVGGSETHATDLAAELIRVAPSVLSAVSLQHALGDSSAARAVVVEGLTTLLEIHPNAFSGAGVAKSLNRLVLRRTLMDQESADSSADYASIDEARRGARKIADERGWLLSELEAEAVTLDAKIRQDKIDREKRREAERIARVRAKSRSMSDPEAPHRKRTGIRLAYRHQY